jgi:ferredoxin-NADP reductase
MSNGGNLMKLMVKSTRVVSQGTKFIALTSAEGRRLPSFQAGAHVTLQLELPGGLELRQYSMLNPPHSDEAVETYEIGVLLEPNGRGGSRWIHDNLVEGRKIEVDGPRNQFQLVDDVSEAMLIAGGIGITPILAMARACEQKQRPYRLIFYARDPDHAPFRSEVDALAAKSASIRFSSDPEFVAGDVYETIAQARPGAHVYVCGPHGLIDAVIAACGQLMISASNVHFERFSPQVGGRCGNEFVVHLARSGRSILVDADQTLLEALRLAGIAVASSCGTGICGSCLVQVVNGAIDHRDEFLMESDRADGSLMCACVSRAKSGEISIDL